MSKTKKITFAVVCAVLLIAAVGGAVWFFNKNKTSGFLSVGNPMRKMPDISPMKEKVNVFAKTETNPYSYAYENPF